MALLDRKLLKKITKLLTPHLDDVSIRRALVAGAFFDVPQLMSIEYSGRANVFASLLVRECDRYGEINPDELALVVLLDEFREYVGNSQNEQIDKLIGEIEKRAAEEVAPPEIETPKKAPSSEKPAENIAQPQPEKITISPPPAKIDFRDALNTALEAYDNKKYAEAVDVLETALSQNPGARMARKMQGLLEDTQQQLTAQQKQQEAATEYALIERMLKSKNELTRKRGCDELQHFRRDFPDYIVENSVKLFCDQPALNRAQNFKGKKNSDWQPYITTFPDLKIPEMKFCLVPPGSFMMGSNDGYEKEKPTHWQTMTSPYWIVQYPVTNAEWKQAVDAGIVPEPEEGNALSWYEDPAMANAPVTGISWFEAQDFAVWLGGRLVTELEWEYAARGIENYIYPWGNEWDAGRSINEENSNKPADVTAKPTGKSWVGAYHMSGNVWEWTNTVFEDYPYEVSDGRENISSGRGRVLRGGSFIADSSLSRCAYRGSYHPPFRNHYLGFRVVCAPSILSL